MRFYCDWSGEVRQRLLRNVFNRQIEWMHRWHNRSDGEWIAESSEFGVEWTELEVATDSVAFAAGSFIYFLRIWFHIYFERIERTKNRKQEKNIIHPFLIYKSVIKMIIIKTKKTPVDHQIRRSRCHRSWLILLQTCRRHGKRDDWNWVEKNEIREFIKIKVVKYRKN